MARESRRSPFLDEVRGALRVKHYSVRTEEAYLHWIKRFIHHHDRRHPAEMGEAEVVGFLTHLAVRSRVAAGTQNQALNALVFLYKHVLKQPLDDITGAVRAKRPQRLPVVLTQDEVRRVLNRLDGVTWLVGCLLYGSGLRLMESLRLRVKDLEFERRAVIVRDGKGAKDRVVTLPDELVEPLENHLGCPDHADLYACSPAWWPGGEESAGRRDPELIRRARNCRWGSGVAVLRADHRRAADVPLSLGPA